jgi:hypothetical protein
VVSALATVRDLYVNGDRGGGDGERPILLDWLHGLDREIEGTKAKVCACCTGEWRGGGATRAAEHGNVFRRDGEKGEALGGVEKKGMGELGTKGDSPSRPRWPSLVGERQVAGMA